MNSLGAWLTAGCQHEAAKMCAWPVWYDFGHDRRFAGSHCFHNVGVKCHIERKRPPNWPLRVRAVEDALTLVGFG
jgi:hypothetical protein